MGNKKFNIKVESSSKYWTDFEGELCVYYHFIWSGSELLNAEDFINEYIGITEKYKIAVPINNIKSVDMKVASLYPLSLLSGKKYKI